MKEDSLEFMCCPFCRGRLVLDRGKVEGNEVSSGFLECSVCENKYTILDGIPDFVLPQLLNPTDKKWMCSYDRTAGSYELMMGTIIPLLSMGSEPLERRRWMKHFRWNSETMFLMFPQELEGTSR